jgi:hypothetical protein
MKRKWLFVIIVVLAVVLCPIVILLGLILFQIPSMPLVAGGRTVAVVKQPLIRPLFSDGWADVYVGTNRIFSLPENYFLDGGPIFIYPFGDGKRFLFDYDDDTAMLDFVVEVGGSVTNKPNSDEWPRDGYVRGYLSSAITNFSIGTGVTIRLPNYDELGEVSSYVNNAMPSLTHAAYFYRIEPKDSLLLDLATNRRACWPIK